jgi:hypothetical protein
MPTNVIRAFAATASAMRSISAVWVKIFSIRSGCAWIAANFGHWFFSISLERDKTKAGRRLF